MKLRWFGRKQETSDDTAGQMFHAAAEGWRFQGGNGTPPANAYIEQLKDEGFVSTGVHGALIPWTKLYSLLAQEEHKSSLHLLQLPPYGKNTPSLRSHDTPAGASFGITLEQWLDDEGAPIDTTRCGAVLETSTGPFLISAPAYALVSALETLDGESHRWNSDQRMLQMGRIQQLAKHAGAALDRYLQASPVVVADTLSLELREETHSGEAIIELTPKPDGAPDGWLSQFDRFDSVQGRYHVTASDGTLTHVVLSEPVREVGESLKAIPRRRLTGAQADTFLQNPYSFLGDAASGVLSPEKFVEAKRAAGVTDWELDLRPGEKEHRWDAVLIDQSGHLASEFLGEMTAAELEPLLAQSRVAQDAGTGVVRWLGRRILLSGNTLESIARLRRGKFETALTGALASENLFDLSYYSDRVAGFDGKPIVVPQIKATTGGQEWISDTTSYKTVDVETGDVYQRSLDANETVELSNRVDAAEQHGRSVVAIPGSEHEIPTKEGRAWIDAIKGISAHTHKKIANPTNPQPDKKLSLRILHNIEKLEYCSSDAQQTDPQFAYEPAAALRSGVLLKEHQIQGVAWMQGRLLQRNDGVRGVLLADDMGLGKTLQALALMAWYRQTAPTPRPCLIVAPVSLLENWKAEIAKFLDGRQGTTITLYGEQLSTYRLGANELGPDLRTLGVKKALTPGFALDAAFVLTTYETLRDFQLSLARERWGVLVCDEAQKIKTPSAMVTRAAKAMQADFRIACTGTPVENSLADLWCLFDFFQPGLLDSLSQFTKVFRQNIELRAEGHEQQIEVLRSQISPWVLRRMKSQVADLKPKTEVPCELAMSPKQSALYAAAAKNFHDAVKSQNGGTAALSLLHRLRLICANPLAATDERSELLPLDDHLQHSPKLAWLLQTLSAIRAKGEKAIVFTEFRDMQRLIQRAIASRLDYHPDIVNGSTSVEAGSDDSRQAIIDRFQAGIGFGVIVLSTTAVGFGVNIQSANHVIHFTRPWNPAKEDQATDRAYRIGQEKEVFVYYPTVTGNGFESFEQRVAQRLATKRTLSTDMLAPEQNLSLQEFTDLPG